MGDEIVVSSVVLDIWKNYRQTVWSDKEACGVLIGGYNSRKKQIVVDSCTTPMEADIRRRFSFILKDKGHQRAVDKAFSESKGVSFYLGTWHSHPTKRPKPSQKDLNDWEKCIARNPQIPCFLFAIVGTKTTYIRSHISNG